MANRANSEHQSGVDRRAFLGKSSAAVIGASLCSSCAIFTSRAKADVQTAPTNGMVVLSKENAAKLANPGGVVRVVSPDDTVRVIIVRRADGTLAALDMACTHWGSDVGFDTKRQQLECPTHGSRFDLTGKVVEGPADEPLTTHRVEEQDGQIRLVLRTA